MKDVIIALDFPSKERTLEFLSVFGSRKPYVKVGMELFYAAGPDLVKRLKGEGYKIFLDLKLHDIPNTVGSAMKVLSGLGADMVNVHAAGTSNMMRAACEAFSEEKERPLLIAVTQLTSTDEKTMQSELLIGESLEKTVMSYAQNAARSGLDGVVCSPLEAAKVHEVCGEKFLTVTPGIRLDDNTGDQKRVTTPIKARELGSDFIVVGRPITKASDPAAVYERIYTEFTGGKL